VDAGAPTQEPGPGLFLELVAMMTATTLESAPGVLVLVADPLFTLGERQAPTGFLSSFSGRTLRTTRLRSATRNPI
jgi:hypothetical protein